MAATQAWCVGRDIREWVSCWLAGQARIIATNGIVFAWALASSASRVCRARRMMVSRCFGAAARMRPSMVVGGMSAIMAVWMLSIPMSLA